jgi:hypothetical protein
MTTWKVLIPLHGSPSAEQLTALTDAIGSDARASDVAVVSGDPDQPAGSVTFTVEATGSSIGEQSGDVTRKVVDICYGGLLYPHEFLGPEIDPDELIPTDSPTVPRKGRAWIKSWRVISYSVHVKVHGSASEAQLEALTEALGSDAGAVASGGPDQPTWSVTLTVTATEPSHAVSTGSKRVRDAALKAKILPVGLDIFHGEATAHDMLGPHPDQMRLQPDEGPIVTKSGQVLTDEDVQALADEAEHG